MTRGRPVNKVANNFPPFCITFEKRGTAHKQRLFNECVGKKGIPIREEFQR